ncbi:unnamed protein product [Effrenium voratum]|nr:unnamed protein product [Effrenium voratum]
MFIRHILLAALPALAASVRVRSAAYEEFRAAYGRGNTSDFAQRLAFFNSRAAKVAAVNGRKNSPWKAALNGLADLSDAEFRRLLGHRPAKRSAESFLQLHSGVRRSDFGHTRLRQLTDELLKLAGREPRAPLPGLPVALDWRSAVNGSGRIREQGACGSCWAAAAAGALELHAEIYGKKAPQELSVKQLLDCVDNPRHCGGKGGCSGASAELAFQYVSKYGLSSHAAYGGDAEREDACAAGVAGRRPHVQLAGFAHLPSNNLHSVLQALTQKGPLVVGVDASRWDIYGSGVFDGCDQDATINHAAMARIPSSAIASGLSATPGERVGAKMATCGCYATIMTGAPKASVARTRTPRRACGARGVPRRCPSAACAASCQTPPIRNMSQ